MLGSPPAGEHVVALRQEMVRQRQADSVGTARDYGELPFGFTHRLLPVGLGVRLSLSTLHSIVARAIQVGHTNHLVAEMVYWTLRN